MLSPESKHALKQAEHAGRTGGHGKKPRKRFYCPGCKAEWEVNKYGLYRLCAFHPGTKLFTMYNKRCATMSRLRWLLRQKGVPLFHPEFQGNYAAFSMGLLGEDGEPMGRLQAVWKNGYEWTLLMQVIGMDGSVRPLDLDLANRILMEHELIDEEEVRVLSVDFTR